MEIRSTVMGDLVAHGTKEEGFYRLSTLMFHEDSHTNLWHERFGSIKDGPLAEVGRSWMMDALPPVVVS